MGRALVVFGTVVWLGATSVTFVLSLYWDSDELQLCALGMTALVCLMLPMYLSRRRLDVFEPITLVAVATILGTAARAPFLAYSESGKVQTLLGGEPISLILQHGGWFLAGLFCLGMGYAFTALRIPIERTKLVRNDYWHPQRMAMVIIVCSIVSAAASMVYVHLADVSFTDITKISMKRAILVYDEYGEGHYTALGHIRMAARLAEFAFCVLLVFMLERRISAVSWQGLWVLGLALMAAVVPFVASSRTGIVILLFSALVILKYRGKLKVVHLGVVIPVIVAIAIAMGTLRSMSRSDGLASSEQKSPIEAIVGSGNFLPIARTAIIMDRVPDRLEFQHGATLVTWIPGFVPRALWPDKPDSSVGRMVRRDIYGLPTWTNGYPPGLLGEGYINFGTMGLLVLPALFGVLLRVFYNSFRPLLRTNKGALLMYVGLLWNLGFNAVGANLSRMVIQSITGLLIVCLMVFAMKSRSIHNLPVARVSFGRPGNA